MDLSYISKDLNSWFSDPDPFYGVVVYQRPGYWRRIAVGAENKEDFEFISGCSSMPVGARPTKDWDNAVQVGTAFNFSDAVKLMFPGAPHAASS